MLYLLLGNFLDSFTASREPTVQLRETKCKTTINANALGVEECTEIVVEGNEVFPVILP